MERDKQQHHRINRKYRRIRTDLPGELQLDGVRESVRILNLSSGGLKFSCGQEVIAHLLPESQRMPGRVTGVEVDIRFQLPLASDKPQSLRAGTRIVYTERLAQDEYHVGVQFVDLDKGVARALQDYIDQHAGSL